MFPLATVVQVFCVYDKILVHGTVEMLLHCQLWTWNLSGLGLLIRILFDLAAPTCAMKLRQFSESPWAFDLDVNPLFVPDHIEMFLFCRLELLVSWRDSCDIALGCLGIKRALNVAFLQWHTVSLQGSFAKIRCSKIGCCKAKHVHSCSILP